MQVSPDTETPASGEDSPFWVGLWFCTSQLTSHVLNGFLFFFQHPTHKAKVYLLYADVAWLPLQSNGGWFGEGGLGMASFPTSLCGWSSDKRGFLCM
jgi:hypothetical protein